jgi:hypothetical protein
VNIVPGGRHYSDKGEIRWKGEAQPKKGGRKGGNQKTSHKHYITFLKVFPGAPNKYVHYFAHINLPNNR